MRKETMSNIITEFETAYASGAYAQELYTLSQAVCFSVLRKLLDKATDSDYNKLTQLRREIMPSVQNIRNTYRLSENISMMHHDENGNYARYDINKLRASLRLKKNQSPSKQKEIKSLIVYVTKELEKEKMIESLLQSSLGDGLELVQECSVAILEEIQKTELPLEIVYTKTVSKKHVFTETAYFTDNTIHDTRDYKTTGIQEVYRHMRKYIRANGGITACISEHTYISIDEVDDAYLRLGKCSDIGGYTCDFNGKQTAYTASMCDAATRNNMIQKMGLTARQAKVLSYLEQGMEQEVIAMKLGVTHRSVWETVSQIRKKAKDNLDISPRVMAKITQPKRNVSQELRDKVLRLCENGHSKRYITQECKCGMSTVYRIISESSN